MRTLIASVFITLAVLSAVAMLLVPPRPPPGVTPLLWASGANPYRPMHIASFNALHPELRLQQDSSNNRFEKIIVQTSSGVGPDMFDVLTGSYLQAYVESGVAWDISPCAAANGIAADIDTWPAIHDEITYGGRQFGYPANVGTYLVLYNKNVFDRFGVPYPEEGSLSWEEFFALLQRVSGAPPGGGAHVWGTNAMSYSGGAPAPIFWKMVFYSRHGEFFSPDGARATIDTEDMRQAFQLHRDALFRHHVLASADELGAMTGQGGWGGGATTQFAEGHFATVIQSKAAVAGLRGFVEEQKRLLVRWLAEPERQLREPRPEVLRLGAMMLPHFAGRPFSCGAFSQTVVINRGSAHRTQALAFLRFLASDAYARMVEVYGMPGDPRMVRYDYPTTHPELAEHELTRGTAESLRLGYQTRKSPFLLDFDVDRVLTEQVARLEVDPSLAVDTLLAEAQKELDGLLRLNVSRDARLAALHRQLTPASPAAMNPAP
jgi:ABC-type glycerol-3-phosphate transport system substrate-binding protein